MTTVDMLRRDLRNYRTLALSIYDTLEASPDLIRNRLAITIDNRTARENPVRLEEFFYFPEVHAWEDEVEAMGDMALVNFVVPMKGWDAYIPYNKVNIGRPSTVARLEAMVPRLPDAYFRKQVGLIMDVFRKSATTSLSYDGQNFFDTDHVHPNGDSYSNKMVADTDFPDWVNKSSPTFAEAQQLIHAVRARFAVNLSIQAEVLDVGEKLDKNLLVIVHNSKHWSMFDRVRTQPIVNLVPNELVGTFQLLQDNKPTSGEEDFIEFVLGDPAGPRPAFLVPDQDPALDAWETDAVRNGYVAVGLKGIYGVKPGFPQSAIQAQPATA